MAIKKELEKSIEIIGSKSDNICWLKLKCGDGGKDFLLGTAYISPMHSSYSKNVLVNQFRTWEILTEELAKFKCQYRIGLVGDFNARTGILPDVIINDDDKYVCLPDDYTTDAGIIPRNNCDSIINQFGERLVELCRMSGLRIVNGRKIGDSAGKKTCHEWNGSSTVDYMLADETVFQQIQAFRIKDTLNHLSDHCPFSTIINFNLCKLNSDQEKMVNSAPKSIKWDAVMEESFKMKMACKNVFEQIEELNSIELGTNENIERVLLKVNSILIDATGVNTCKRSFTKKFKRKKSKKTKNPWFTNDLVALKRNLKQVGAEFVKNTKDNTLRQRFFKLKKRFKMEVKHKKRQFKQSLYDKLEKISTENPKEYWELFDKLKSCPKNSNQVNNDCPIKDEEWIAHYLKLLGPQQYNSDRMKEVRDETFGIEKEPYFSELDYSISITEIMDASRSLKNNKASGLDCIRNEMVKCSLPFMASLFRNIFNANLCNQYYPSCWKTGMIINLFKSGDANSTDNYRGLTINSCLAKLFNTILNNRLIKFLEKNKIICDNQIGFKRKARTSDHIFIINTLFRKFCKSNKKLYLCFIDFSKAYDTVWQEALMLKLLRIGVKGKFFGTIKAMYKESNACIKSNGSLSDTFECKSGVKQGDVLSPNLFNIYINDLPAIFDGDSDSPKLNDLYVHCLMYADDLVLISLTEEGLQNKLNKLHNYCCKWALNINIKKTQVMAMSSSKMDLPNKVMHIGDSKLQWVNTYKYLGILINSNGDFLASSDNLCVRGWKASFKIKSALKDVDIDPSLKLKLFDSLIKPIVCYNSEIWGVMNNVFNSKSISQFWDRVEKLPVEKFQLKFCKGLLGVNPKACNAAVMGEVGRLPMFINIIKSVLNYLAHIIEVKGERPLLNAAFEEDSLLCISKSWRNRLEKILSFFQCNINVTPTNELISRLQNKMKESYIDYWGLSLGDVQSEEGRLHLYRHLKKDFKIEPYLKHIRKFKYRKAMTAFRIGSHKLEIETGRYVRRANIHNLHNHDVHIKREDRFCTLCYEESRIKVIGDEKHAIVHCPSFYHQRLKLLTQFESICPNFNNLKDSERVFYMLTCENECVVKVSKFLNFILSSQRPSLSKVLKLLDEEKT